MSNPLQAVLNHRSNNGYNSKNNPQLDADIESILIDFIDFPMVRFIPNDDKKVLKDNQKRTLGIYERLVIDKTIPRDYIPNFIILFRTLWPPPPPKGGRRTRRKRAHRRTRHRK
jgi:hypothetical protein